MKALDLKDGRSCSIDDLTPSILWKATFRAARNHDKEYDLTPYILEQIITIDGEPVTIDQLDQLSIDDYLSILDVLEHVTRKLNL